MNKNYNVWVEKGLKKGLTDIEIYATNSSSLSLEIYEGQVEKNEVSQVNIALIKGIYNGKAAKVKVENYSDESIDFMLDALIDAASNVTANEPALIYEGSNEYHLVDEKLFDFDSVEPSRKLELLLEIEAGIKKNELLDKVETVSYSETESKTVIVNSKGLNLAKHHRYAMIYASGVYKLEDQVKSGMSYKVVKDFNEFNAKELIEENILDGTSQLGASSMESKVYPVVFSNEMFSSILAVFEGIFTGEAAFRKVTKLLGKENTKIANDLVNLVDDPFNEKALFKVPFDDEGVASSKRYWIKDGVFTDFAHNLKTAEIFGKTSTGNGFTSGIGATNLVLEPGTNSLEELFATIDNGVYITSLVGLHAGVETVSGDFSLQAAGFEIVDGKKGRAVDMLVVSGNFFKLLNDLEMIANDFKFGMYGVGTAAVKIKELTIGGK